MTGSFRLKFAPIAVTAALAAVACGPVVRRAPFRQVPSSVKPGELVGPYDGQVVDRDTGKPLEKATVWCSWGFERGVAVSQPYAARTHATQTDVDGRYRIPRLRDLPSGLSTRLARFSLRVYKRGYVVFHEAWTFGGPRQFVFSQRDATVKLKRWTADLSHAEHLLFAAGGESVVQASRWERVLAARELDASVSPRDLAGSVPLTGAPPGSAITAPHAGQAASLLSVDELRAVTGDEGTLRAQPLANSGDTTATVHFRAVDRPERFDVALRLWRLRGSELNTKYESLVGSLQGTPSKEIGDQSFVATQGDIFGLVFYEESRGALVLLTCGQGQCPTQEVLVSLGHVVSRNLARLPQQDPSSEPPDPDAAPQPVSPEPDVEGPQ